MAEPTPSPVPGGVDRESVRRESRARRERVTCAGRTIGLLLIGVVGAGVLLRIPEDWWVPAAGAVALAGLVFRLAHWKCPACGAALGTRGPLHECPACGSPLE
jgi:hypothetical protein